METLPDTRMEAVNDREGDCGISIAVLAESEAHVKKLTETLRAEGVVGGCFSLKQIPDRHVFYHWDYIMEKRSPHLNGFPWNTLDASRKIEYSKDMCPQTMDILNRVFLMPISQGMSDEYVDQVCQAIEKVAHA